MTYKSLIVTLLLSMTSGCENDEPRITDVPRSPESKYKGEYLVLRSDQNGFDTSLAQDIYWLFSDFKFWMEVTDSDERPRMLCDAVGYYRLTEIITFFNTVRISDSCDASEYPEGAFQLRRTLSNGQVDSLLMIQVTDSCIREIRLARRSY